MAQYPGKQVENDGHWCIDSDQKQHSWLHSCLRRNYFPSAVTKSTPLSKSLGFLSLAPNVNLRGKPAELDSWRHECWEIQRRKEVNVHLKLIWSSNAVGSHLIQWFKHVEKEDMCQLTLLRLLIKAGSDFKDTKASVLSFYKQNDNENTKLFQKASEKSRAQTYFA